MKRITALSFLIAANMLLLAVAVVPHHHHGEAICLVGAHCYHGHEATDEGSCRSHTPESPQGHGHPDDANCCNVGEWLLPNIESQHRHQPHQLCTTCHHGCDGFVAILPSLQQHTTQLASLPFRQTPPLLTALPTLAGRIHGLRAPPFC